MLQEAELEDVFDKLLCGSMENVLFADENGYSVSAVSSVCSPRSSSLPTDKSAQRPHLLVGL